MKPQLQITFGDEILPLEIVNEVPLEAKTSRSDNDRAFEFMSDWFDRISVIDSSARQHSFEKTIGQIIRGNGNVKNVRGLWPREFRDDGEERIFKFAYDQAETGAVVYMTTKELDQRLLRSWTFGVLIGAAAVLGSIIISMIFGKY